MAITTVEGSNGDKEREWLTAVSRYIPLIKTIQTYQTSYLTGDLIAGLIVAIMLIPQGMAYALLAGLPPQAGLYASIVPLMLYGIFGTSRFLAVGPVAIVSLLTATSISMLAAESGAAYWQLALTLALLVGIIQTAMGLFRVGFLVNFLSHPVLVGFSASAAIVIGFSQVKALLGFSVPRTTYFYEQVWAVFANLHQTNWVSLAIGLFGIGILIYFKSYLGKQLKMRQVPEVLATPICKIAPLLIVVVTTLVVASFRLDQLAGVAIVGDVPAGLPPMTLPSFSFKTWQLLMATAVAISFVGYMESISVAKSLASRRRQKVDANQELIALGVANIGAAFTGGYPVTGGFSRSLVNYSAGASTTVASIITAVLIGLSLLFLTPLFYFLPKATLAAIIIVAVSGLIDIHTIKRVWRYSKKDAMALLITFLAVLGIGIEQGILVGAGASLILYIYRTSNPHVAIVGQLDESQIYRNVSRHPVKTWPEVALIRIDASLYFANSKLLEHTVLSAVAERCDVKFVVLIGTAVNDIDFSALETLETLWHELEENDIELHFAAIKGPVMDGLKKCKFVEHIGTDRFHLTTHDAMKALGFV